MPVTIIAEAGVNHNGDLEMAKKLALTAKECGADIVTPETIDHIANLFEMVGAIEKEHEERYRRLLKNVEDKLVFSRDGDCVWQCSNCGYIHEGEKAPEVCPVCAHPKAFFQIHATNY